MLTLINNMKSFFYENINMGIIESIPDVKNRFLAPDVPNQQMAEFHVPDMTCPAGRYTLLDMPWAKFFPGFTCWVIQMVHRGKITIHKSSYLVDGANFDHFWPIFRRFHSPDRV